ncbi:MAG: MBL fold metallo-hydrolase [Chloroflexota bacterium]
MRVMALASGSSGNAYLVRAGDSAVVIDAGVSLATLHRTLPLLGLEPSALRALLLTHEHSDHTSNAAMFCWRLGIPALGSAGTLAALRSKRAERQPLRLGERTQVGELSVTAFPVPHDGVQPVGYLLEHDGARVCLATDLGHVPAELRPILSNCQLVVLEANHDVGMLWHGSYPWPLKQRVASPTGHLSNEQTAECLLATAGSEDRDVWLAHLSASNNSPQVALGTVAEHIRAAGIRNMRLQVAKRDRPSLTWDSTRKSLQPELF